MAATVDAGARTVIGFQNSVHYSACNEWCEVFFEYFVSYYNDDTKNYYDVCIATNNILKNHEKYEYFDNSEDDKDGSKDKLISLRNYVIAGEESLP